MPIKVPAVERGYRRTPDRQTAKGRAFGEEMRAGFRAKADRRAQRLADIINPPDALELARREAVEARRLADEEKRQTFP
jgi:hypothetical protein